MTSRIQPSFTLSRAQPGERHGSVSEADSDEENEEGDYTVYECPGLAPVSLIIVKFNYIINFYTNF